MIVALQREARRDLEDATSWYESKASGLGDEFLFEIEFAFEQIGEFPEASPIVYRGFRRHVLHRFPFCVFYTVAETQIDVVAVHHASRDPNAWKTRA